MSKIEVDAIEPQSGTTLTIGDAGDANTEGTNNVALGDSALSANTTADGNTAVGRASLFSNTTGASNTAVGNDALFANTTASNNTAVGYQSLCANTTGAENTAVGCGALKVNTEGSSVIAIGTNALCSNTTACWNVAVGSGTMPNNSTGNRNVGIGHNAINGNTTGSGNTAVGGLNAGTFPVMYANTTGSENSAFGSAALCSNTEGSNNVAVGSLSLQSLTTGCYNVAIGNTSSVLQTGCYNVLLGAQLDSSASGVSCEILIGRNITGKGTSTGFIGATSGVYQGNNSSSWSTTSDRRIKKNITDNTIGLNKINQIQVKNFEYRTPDEITELPKHSAINKQGVQVGVIAQEIELILPDVVKEESTGVKSVNPDNLTWYMINAIKELKAEIELLKNK
jgi:trimeric autotransporter adhesin